MRFKYTSSSIYFLFPHAFGMEMNGRKWQGTANNFRFSYNGKEDDKASGWQTQDYGFRTYDYRLGRFYSQDPIYKKFADLTPYQFASNTPIQAIDLDGLEAVAIVGGADFSNQGLSKTVKSIETNIKEYAISIGMDPSKVKAFNSNPNGIGLLKQQLKEFIVSNNKKGEPAIIYGYSLGGTVSQNVLQEINKENPNIKIELFITVDAALGPFSGPLEIPPNTEVNFNFYQQDESNIRSSGSPNYAKDPKKTKVYNMDQTGTVSKNPKDAHGEMDEKNKNVSENIIKLKLNEIQETKSNDKNEKGE